MSKSKQKVFVRAAFRRMQVYLAIHLNVDLRKGNMRTVCSEYAKALGIELVPGKRGHVAFLLEQYNNPESKIFKGNNPLKSPFKSNRAKKLEKTKRRKEYIGYLKSEKWISFRNSIKEKRGNKCEICGISGVVLDGHHLTYARFMNELETDIQIVCRECHNKIHGNKHNKKPKSKAGRKAVRR